MNTGKVKIGLLFILLCIWGFSYPAYAGYEAPDPTYLTPNARVLALGKAYVGLGEGTAAIFTNPAGMADAKGWQWTSMSGKLLEEYSYLSFAGFYSTDQGVFGLGYSGSSIAGAFPTIIDPDSDPDDPVYAIDPSLPQMGYANKALVLSYANRLSERLTWGTNIKLISAALSGGNIVDGDASGTQLDVGVKYFPQQKWFTLGVVWRNLLPQNLGGQLEYSNHEESYPAVIKLGTAINLIGRNDALYKLAGHEAQLLLDVDSHPTLSSIPLLWHIGAEWKPISMLSLRAGFDQDVIGKESGGVEVVTDLAYGVGVEVNGFCFDYAYRTFTGIPGVGNNYFSLSYQFEPAASSRPQKGSL
ncbi:PorV/PorQ family protein [Candidatus Margulisiibacteriota bacterium]